MPTIAREPAPRPARPVRAPSPVPLLPVPLLPVLLLSAVLLAPAPAAAQIIPGPVTGDPGTERPTFVDREEPGNEERPGIEERPEIEEPTEETLRSSVTHTTNSISSRVNRALALGPAPGDQDDEEEQAAQAREDGGAAGFLAGGAFAAWANAGVTWLDSDFTGAEYDGTVILPLAGADYVLEQGMVFGLSLGYERIDLDTAFNDGSIEGDGFSITPYFGSRIGENFVVDAGVGYTRLSYDRERREGGVRRTGSFDADRIFTFANLAAYAPQEWIGVDGLVTVGRLGFRYSNEDQDGFVESTGARISGGTIELGQVTIGAEARYYPEVDFTEQLELFASVVGTIDAIRSERDETGGFASGSDDRTGVTFGLGAVAAVTERVSVDLSYEQVLFREDLTELTVTAGVRVDF